MDTERVRRIARNYAEQNPKVAFLPPALLGLVGTIVAIMGWCFPIGPLMCVAAGFWTAKLAVARVWNRSTRRFRR